MLASLGARAVEGVQERTVAGALVTFGAVVSIVLLLFLECSSFFAPLTIHHVGVDDGDAAVGWRRVTLPDRLSIELHATFAHVPCDDLELSVEATRGLREAINSVDMRRATSAELEGWAPDAVPERTCTLDGKLTVGKVAAHFSAALRMDAGADAKEKASLVGLPEPLARLVGQINAMERHRHANVTHRIHALRFGDRTPPGAPSPLDDVVNAPTQAGQMHYTLKVIPTVVSGWFSDALAYQYSLAEAFIPERRLLADPSATPGAFFFYDFYPVTIHIANERKSPPEFLVSICAIVGGCMGLAALVDGFVFKSAKVLTGKKD